METELDRGEHNDRVRLALGESPDEDRTINLGDQNRAFGLVTGRMLVDIYADLYPENVALQRCPRRQRVDAGKFPKLVSRAGARATVDSNLTVVYQETLMHLFEDWVRCIQGAYSTHKKRVLKMARAKQAATTEAPVNLGINQFDVLFHGLEASTKVENNVRKAAAHIRYLIDVGGESGWSCSELLLLTFCGRATWRSSMTRSFKGKCCVPL